MKILIALLAILGATFAQTEPFGTEICRLFANGVKLRQPGTCGAYITCQNGVSQVTNCNGKFYNKDKGTCVTKAPDTYCKDPCTSKSALWVKDPKTCTGYYTCISGVGTESKCPNELHFSQTTQACVYASDSTCEGYDFCDVVPNDVPFKDETNCQGYYMCVKAKLTALLCENGNYYHALFGCIDKTMVECDDHPVPISACGTAKKPIRDKFVNDGHSCRGYLYCHDRGDNVADLEPTWGQCPEGRFFEYDVQGCYPATAVKCTEDLCDGRQHEKVVSRTPGCQHYLICNGDETVEEQKCADGLYFDDDKMECTSSVMKYTTCS